MVEYTYSKVAGKIGSLLSKIREVGVPPKVTNNWLKSIGFKSSNDGSLLRVLKYVGLVDASNLPTSTWTQYRGSKHKQVLGDAIRTGYSELYAVYPDAHKRSDDELDHIFSTSSAGGKQVVNATIATFRALVKEAEFSGVAKSQTHPPDLEPTGKAASIATATMAPTAAAATGPVGPALHIDVQIHISPDASPEQIEKIFSSMAKHLYKA